MPKTTAILLAHGSRDPDWQSPFAHLAGQLSETLGAGAVRQAYLQFGSPTLGEALVAAEAEGFDRAVVLPLFLSVGGHVARDIPAEAEAARQRLPGLAVEVLPAIGEDPRFLDLIARCVAESLQP